MRDCRISRPTGSEVIPFFYGGTEMAYKRKEVNGYADGKKVAKNLIALALRENKMLIEVKAELMRHFPAIVFKAE